MAKDDYVAAGGALKLKGAKPSGITKKKKKSKSKPKALEEQQHASSSKPPMSEADVEASGSETERQPEDELSDPYAGKTPAERRFEERRRKLMDERLKKEGVKTHKERVEEYNKYLASLSEHHDMPRIGPG